MNVAFSLCSQEKEFEVTNEYIFALGSHVIYWSSKDVSLFVAQQVVADAMNTKDKAQEPSATKREAEEAAKERRASNPSNRASDGT